MSIKPFGIIFNQKGLYRDHIEQFTRDQSASFLDEKPG